MDGKAKRALSKKQKTRLAFLYGYPLYCRSLSRFDHTVFEIKQLILCVSMQKE